MGELHSALESFPVWKGSVVFWSSIAMLVLIELLLRDFDDDDDQGGGMMIPAYQGIK